MTASSARLILICCSLLAGSRLPLAGQGHAPAAAGAAKEESLPAEIMGFQGKVTGTVVAVDAAKAMMTVKVAKAEAHAANNKAPKPEALQGRTITVTTLTVRQGNGPEVPEEKAAAYIKGARAGDAVTVEVRTSSKGVVFRLLKVPTAAKR